MGWARSGLGGDEVDAGNGGTKLSCWREENVMSNKSIALDM